MSYCVLLGFHRVAVQGHNHLYVYSEVRLTVLIMAYPRKVCGLLPKALCIFSKAELVFNLQSTHV